MDSLFQSEVFSSSSWSYESLKNFGPITTSVQNHLKLNQPQSIQVSTDDRILRYFSRSYISSNQPQTIPVSTPNRVPHAVPRCCRFRWGGVSPHPLQHWRCDNRHIKFGTCNLDPTYSCIRSRATIGALIGLVLDINPRTIVTALIGSGFAFGCFSATAMVAKRRQLLFLGGLLSSGLTILLWLHLTSSIFGGSTAHFNAEIYFGLLLFLGYIVFDTQLMIERAASGGRDYILDCLLLFVDFCGVFIRMITNLVNNATERDRRRKR
ncbi:bax inhibitor 1-like isoform X1 [Wolffia australiana]